MVTGRVLFFDSCFLRVSSMPEKPQSHRDTEKAQRCLLILNAKAQRREDAKPPAHPETTESQRHREGTEQPTPSNRNRRSRRSTQIYPGLPTDHTDDMTAGWPWQPSRNVILSEGAKRPSRRICVLSDPSPTLQRRDAEPQKRREGDKVILCVARFPAVQVRPGNAGPQTRLESELSCRFFDRRIRGIA
jgi:hypothetical protein